MLLGYIDGIIRKEHKEQVWNSLTATKNLFAKHMEKSKSNKKEKYILKND